mgnify:FL=1|tara:strand:+ start:6366 stop:6932 length:567 start_codon:yes stop_codon:yes gene_type:complete
MDLRDRVFKYKFEKHHDLKDILLDKISKSESETVEEEENDNSIISSTDFFIGLKRKHKAPYYWFFEDNLDNFFEFLSEKYFMDTWNIGHAWYQQYVTGDSHDWHIHPEANLSYVYYLELEDPKYATQFFDAEKQEFYQPEAEEGDIIVFDSYIPHRSPKIQSTTRKTIISCNLSFDFSLDVSRIKSLL